MPAVPAGKDVGVIVIGQKLELGADEDEAAGSDKPTSIVKMIRTISLNNQYG